MSRPGLIRRAAPAILATAALWLPLAATHADDTELYIGQAAGNPAAGNANILFILDNSGSMQSAVQTQAEWDPDQQFSGCFRSDAVYISNSSAPPPCAGAVEVPKAANRCAAALPALRSRGQYSDQLLGWDPDAQLWQPLDTGGANAYLECHADRGVDGSGSGGNAYAANGSAGPWAANAGNEPGWTAQATVFDGNWLNWRSNPPTVTRSRLEIVQQVVKDVLDNLQDVNVGLMQFNFSEGGTVSHAIADISTSRQAIKDTVDALTASTRTPLSESLFEATNYFRGGPVGFGNIGPVLSVPAARLNGNASSNTYLSPVTAECQRNFIILLTDGEPSSDDNSTPSLVADLPGFPALIGSCDGSGNGACLDDLAEYLNRADAAPGIPGLQNVVTYTIGFELDVPLLESTARRGGGRYYVADDTGSLATALSSVIAGIAERSGTFVAPAIPVNAYNRAASDRDVYVSMFRPTGTAHWPGNLKKYRFSGNALVDQDGQPAVDPVTGFIQPTARSFWSAVADGDRVAEGGAAGQLPSHAARHVYTDIGGPQLTAAANRVEVANSALTAAMLGVAATQREELINWIRGADAADIDGDGDRSETRRQMGDPLHVRPVAVNYGSSADDPDTMVYVATNDGFLHAVNAANGIEHWAYLPSRLLARQNALFLDALTPVRSYGLDGEIRLYVRNNDGQPGITGSEQAILLFGMGRGGTGVFAIDVTNPGYPVLLWQIDRQSPGFGALGQTWAAPEVAKLTIGSATHEAVILSGGYDDAQDNRGYREDNVGNALYFIDLLTGECLWSAGASGQGHDLVLPTMRHSIPAAPKVIDLTGDGLADRLYVGDMGGRLWRFDVLNGHDRASLVSAGVLASLGAADLASPDAADVRRFHATPDVVLVDCIRGTFLAINIGSGYRGHPLDTDADDQFFSVRDPNVYVALDTASYGEPIRVTDLMDITDDPDAEVPVDAAGWRLRLEQDPGEKVLTPAVTFDNTLFFTSFAPGAAVSACAGGIGINRAYQVGICNGRPLTNLDGSSEDDPLAITDRFVTLSQTGIAPGPALLFPPNGIGKPTRCIGLSCFPPPAGSGTASRTYWMQERAR
ncbi:MAG: type IV pili system adhesin PilY [Gammaproteobacteria bacterium]|nr:MAG: type IV pili system adhesin PilY [Gammaproteobacteria bacterium]